MNDRVVNEAFGQRVRAALAISRVSRHEMAKACSVSPQAVQRWADGTAFPSSGNLARLCELTGCSMEWMMWPFPIDMQTTDWAINGVHIKNIVKQTIDEISSQGETP